MILEFINSLLQKQLEKKKRRVVKLRWQKEELEQLLKELESRKGEKKHGSIGL